MPPLVEEEESGSGDEIPYKADKNAAKDDSGEDDGEDEYVIEKIVGHAWGDNGEVLYDVKWEGWDDPSERTMEPEENLETARESLEEYWNEIGGKPTKKPATKGGRKRKAAGTSKTTLVKRTRSETPELSTKKKRGGANDEFKLPKGSWEDQVASIDTIEEAVDEKGDMQRYVYVLWQNGHKTRHQLGTVNAKCPQKMLQYYESHLVFRSPDVGTNGDAV